MFDRKKILAVLLILLIGRVFLMFIFPVSDPSEARYALIIQHMTETGNYLEPKLFHDGAWINFEGKPPLFFQIGGLCSEVLGINPFSARLPSLLAALGILAIVYFSLKKMRDEHTALLATLFCFSSVVFFLFSGLAMTDMTLNLAVTGAIFSYMLFSYSEKRRLKKIFSICFFASLAVGMLAKGPVAIVMAGLPIFIFVLWNNRWKELKDHAWIAGSICFLAIAAPWFILMTRKNPDFLEYFFVNENLKRFLFKEYGDRYGAGRETFRGMAVVWFLLSTLPAFLLLIPSFFKRKERSSLIVRKDLADPVVGLSFLGFVCITLFWSLTSRVLITYLLPSIPLFSVYLTEKLKENETLRNPVFNKILRIGFPVFSLVLVIGFVIAAFVGPHTSDKMPQVLYRKVEKLMKENPELASKQLYFAKNTPYSAVLFFPGNTIRHHADEDVRSSLESSKKDIFFARKFNLRRDKKPLPRKLLFRECGWEVYAPEAVIEGF